jgi:uncharacterized membrane protein (UPF0136 family)
MALYGFISIAGGMVGYVRADSLISLVAGGIAGVLLLLCAAGVFYFPVLSLGAAIIISIALLGRFLPNVIRHRDNFGEFLPTPGGSVAVLMVIGGLLTVVFSALALATRANPPGGA